MNCGVAVVWRGVAEISLDSCVESHRKTDSVSWHASKAEWYDKELSVLIVIMLRKIGFFYFKTHSEQVHQLKRGCLLYHFTTRCRSFARVGNLNKRRCHWTKLSNSVHSLLPLLLLVLEPPPAVLGRRRGYTLESRQFTEGPQRKTNSLELGAKELKLMLRERANATQNCPRPGNRTHILPAV